MKIVPEKRTTEMEDAGTKALSDSGVDDVFVSVPDEGVIGDATKCYEAMVAVAPTPEAVWEDGEPANLLAAGQDAYAWLEWLNTHAQAFLMKQEDQGRLTNCMAALSSFLRPNVEVTGAARLYRAASVWTAGLCVAESLRATVFWIQSCLKIQ